MFKPHLLLILCLIVLNSPSAATRPNIMFIMSDDHAAPAVGAYGSHLAELNPTPNLDRLATEGVLFENAFCNNSICTPSRASIITGQYPQTNGICGYIQGYHNGHKQSGLGGEDGIHGIEGYLQKRTVYMAW